MAVFPPDAMHAVLLLGKDLYAEFHPLAVAAVFLDTADFEEAARRERHRLEVAREAAGDGALAAFWSVHLSVLDAVVSAAKADAARVRAAPARLSADSAGYCPLCFVEYRAGFPTCSDCDTALRAF